MNLKQEQDDLAEIAGYIGLACIVTAIDVYLAMCIIQWFN